jgi:predicted MFS family arabinose efflux permease
MPRPECGARDYSRMTKPPEWHCSECGQTLGRSGSSRSILDCSPTTWSLFVDAPLICRRRVYGQGGNADAWAAPGGIGRRFWHVYSCGGTAGRSHLRHLGNNCPLVGPISDTYGRRPVLLIGLLLMALGVLGSGAAWSYGSLLATRLITGVGSAMLPMSMMAALADNLPSDKVGKAVGFITASSWVGLALGVPAIALLGYIGGWRLPFYITGGLSLALWVMLWFWLPRSSRRSDQGIDLLNRFKVIGRQSAPWYVLIANATQQIALFGLMTYFAAHMIEGYGWNEASTAPGLALLGVGAVIGSFAGGFIAGRARRLDWLAAISLVGGVVAGLLFALGTSAWIVVAMAFVASVLVSVSMPVLLTLIMHLAGQSRGTAGGMLSTSNQFGSLVGASAGGLMLSLGGFPAVGYLCLVATVLSASVVGLKMRRSPAFQWDGPMRDGRNVG